MSASPHDTTPPVAEMAGHGSKQSYLVGFGLSAVLTAIPFWLVMSGALGSPGWTAIAVILFAVLQILVHTTCFLHVNTQAEGGWSMIAYIFTAVILIITIAGSLWIMFHLNSNMMPSMMVGEPSNVS
ncbi:cytochrome o ubiquinol oxidase subunit IV [Sphingomonas sabuli]|jgi:cytochrome o ubiquinol oxidase operon protein cyoD|uniref:Cytochrome bo(3) ubiquinol oxidase subunit 4 n=1 Tax=Sphingomonas sabuli TaxID=2764186 RepID=A0A7G9L1V3_9SPHN|nr:cytochrome o ubiquinol oxidase subunit IV [Sphingomonas sabuli]QNM82602.1 cytochrome o ubiquinol oxidase subunit IV [Sphingomonas sabuli]